MNRRELREARKALGFTQAELASLLDLSPSGVWKREAGRVKVRLPEEITIKLALIACKGFTTPSALLALIRADVDPTQESLL